MKHVFDSKNSKSFVYVLLQFTNINSQRALAKSFFLSTGMIIIPLSKRGSNPGVTFQQIKYNHHPPQTNKIFHIIFLNILLYLCLE